MKNDLSVTEVVSFAVGILFSLGVALVCIAVLLRNPQPLQIVISLIFGVPSILFAASLCLTLLRLLFNNGRRGLNEPHN